MLVTLLVGSVSVPLFAHSGSMNHGPTLYRRPGGMTVDMVSYLQSIAIPTPGARPLVGQYLALFAQETVQRRETVR
jgi:hypothetical protein